MTSMSTNNNSSFCHYNNNNKLYIAVLDTTEYNRYNNISVGRIMIDTLINTISSYCHYSDNNKLPALDTTESIYNTCRYNL